MDALNAAIVSVAVNGESREVVEQCTYLGSIIHQSADCKAEINSRLGLAYGLAEQDSGAFPVSEHADESVLVPGPPGLTLLC